jgi:hypothetical protein
MGSELSLTRARTARMVTDDLNRLCRVIVARIARRAGGSWVNRL